ncbi:MAG: ABC transporter ATP-binding protein [Gammaproteobacteria bacterium]
MQTTNPAIIEVEHLVYEYPGLRALDDVGFTIEAGSVTALVGPNGAGKTSLLRCLAGMDRPLAGRIRVAGIDVVAEPRRSHRAVGYLADFFGLYAELSVRRCLDYVAAANGVDRDTRAALVAQTAAELGLAERLDQRAGELSRGLRQRLAIAQAVIHAPRVILLDEPAAGLDPEARYQLGELIMALRDRGMTLIVSSHILAELESYSSALLILRDGRVVEHRALGVARAPLARVELEVTGAAESAHAVLAAQPAVSAIEVDAAYPGRLRCAVRGGAAERAGVLAALVNADIGVAHFALLREDLQQSYLRSLARAADEAFRDEP